MRIAIIGCGTMGAGLARSFAQDHILYLFDKEEPKSSKIAEQLPFASSMASVKLAVKEAEIILLAVKPQSLEEVAQELAEYLHSKQVLVSILAGVPLKRLKDLFKAPIVVRAMPNLPLIYQEGVVGLSQIEHLSSSLHKQLDSLFQCCGTVFWLPEKQFDALTSLTASGPAFILTWIESMVEAGIAMGFSPAEAQKLTLQTIQGTLTLLKETGQHPGFLKWQVASPAGTTIAGLVSQEEGGTRNGILKTFLAAHRRAEELGKLDAPF